MPSWPSRALLTASNTEQRHSARNSQKLRLVDIKTSRTQMSCQVDVNWPSLILRPLSVQQWLSSKVSSLNWLTICLPLACWIMCIQFVLVYDSAFCNSSICKDAVLAWALGHREGCTNVQCVKIRLQQCPQVSLETFGDLAFSLAFMQKLDGWMEVRIATKDCYWCGCFCFQVLFNPPVFLE